MFSRQSGLRAVLALAAALVLVTGVFLVSGQPSQREALLAAAPAELALPADPRQLGAWCTARKAQGTAGLSQRARNWLNDCITLFGGPAPTPSATQSPTPSPSPSTQPSPSVTPTATTPPATTPPASTPPPSPSPTVGLRDCLHQLAACGFPNADNTGPTGALTVVSGNVSLDNDGQVLRDVEVRGCVEVHGTGVLIANVRVVGDCFYAVRNFASGLVIEDSEISCDGGNGTGVTATGYTVRRSEVTACENGFNVGGNVVVEDSWIHDLTTANGAHTDGAQINQGAQHIVFRHNTILTALPGGTAAIIGWDEGDPQMQDVRIDANLLSGGTYTLYCARYGASTTYVTNNRFGPHQYGHANQCVGDHVSAWTNNVDDATGAPLAAA